MLELNFKPFPTLETERMVIRRITKKDVDDLFFLRTNEETMTYLDRAKAASTEEVKDLIRKIDTGIKQNTAIGWGISLKNHTELIGTISYHRIEKEHYRAEVGYMLKPAYWKQGLISEALKKVIDYGFNHMKLHSIEANVNPNNAGSIMLLEKMGFVKEAHFKENYYYNGQFLDSVIYSLISANH